VTNTTPEELSGALAYASLGWHVFPCEPAGKRPLTDHGLKDATTDPEQLRAWWAHWPDANVAIVTGAISGLVVIDVDADKDGEATLELLEALHGQLPETVRAITGGDGWHYLFAHPGGEIRNTAGRLGRGVDTRGDGGYIIAAPSLHASGQRYEWVTEPTDPLAALPTWILDDLARPVDPPAVTSMPAPPASSTTAYARKVLEERAAEVARAGEGERNHTLNAAAFRLGQLVAGGQLPEADATSTLTRAAAVCGLGETETERTIRSGLDAGRREPQHPDPTRTRTTTPTSSASSTSGGGDVDEEPVIVATTVHDALADGFRGTDAGNADRFVAAVDGHARYVHAWGRWIVYDTTAGVWRIDLNDALVVEQAKTVARAMFTRAARLSGDARDTLWKWAKRSESATAIANMVRLARGTPGVLVNHAELDAKPWLLNVLNGTIDLQTGELRPHDPDDLLTVQAPTRYDPDALAPLWDACLERWQPDPAMRAYLQQVIGTGATGQAIEHLFVNLGPGGNGKSKFYGAVSSVLGAYVVIPHKSLITVQRHEQHDTIKARLFGARLAIASETDANDRIDEAKLKELTGGDLIEARRMREDPWQFRQTHTLIMHTNHRPRIHGVDEGVWRRIRLIPWNVTIPLEERDEHLADKLAAEAPGILNWILAGTATHRAHGFTEPASVADATAGYRAGQDVLAGFLEECIQPLDGHRAPVKEIVEAYERWCESTGEEGLTKNALGRALQDRGYTLTNDRRYRVGLRLLEPGDARIVPSSQFPTRARAHDEQTGNVAQSAHPPGRPPDQPLPPAFPNDDTWEL